MIGEKAPDFCLKDENNKSICLKDFIGKWIVLYFYPKDMTPGCTQEACDFTEKITDFEGLNAEIIGISPDPPERHKKFREKYQLKHVLLSDTEHKVIEKYGAWKKKKMYGKEYYGVERSTFIINPEGKVAYEWRKVKVKGHVEEVKKKLKELQE